MEFLENLNRRVATPTTKNLQQSHALYNRRKLKICKRPPESMVETIPSCGTSSDYGIGAVKNELHKYFLIY